MICSYINNCKAQGVTIELNTSVTPELLREKKPDAVIVATGSKPLMLLIPGIEKDSTWQMY